ncbi:hypothetical protein BJF78_33890 [Pseudonocardia sp. CNS-139]|nr:hypothetical protein BJF78_33890 [Pseudonocardia sp. CNS-139]
MDFNAIAGKAGELLNEHSEEVEAAVEKVGEVVKEKYGHAEQVDMAVDKIKELIPDGDAAQPPAAEPPAAPAAGPAAGH